eukprot:g14911.t1
MDHQQMSWRDWHGLWMEHFHNEAVRRGCSIDELIALFDVWCVLCMNEGYLSPDVEETARIAQAPPGDGVGVRARRACGGVLLMADRWCKLLARARASDRVSDSIEKGGPDAWLVFSGLLMIHADFGVGGKLDAGTSRPGRIRNELSAFMMTRKRVEDGLDALEAAGMLSRDKAGAITLSGWGNDVAPTCVRCHRPNPEPSKATCPSCRASFAKSKKRAAAAAAKAMEEEDGIAMDREGIAMDRDPIEGDPMESLRDKDKDVDLYKDPDEDPDRGHAAGVRTATRFAQLVESEMRRLDAMTGRPAPRRALIAQLEEQGMTSGEFRTLIAWFERQTSSEGPGHLVEILQSEEMWRDVLDVEAERRHREAESGVGASTDADHYPGMPEQRYETNPVIRELGRRPPFTGQDAVDAYRAGLGLNLWALAFHLGWSDDAEFREHRRSGKEPPGVTRLRKALRTAGIDLEPWSWRAKKPQETPAQRRQRTEQDERHARVQAWMRIRTGRARDGDQQLIEGWEVPEALQE